MLEYLLKSSALLGIFVTFYYVFLRNATFFKSIRIFLASSLLLSILLPLIEIPIYKEVQEFDMSNFSLAAVQNIENNSSPILTWQTILITVYIVGVSFMLLKFIVQLFSLVNFFVKNKIEFKNGYYFIETSSEISPFSFFNIIVFNKNLFNEDELNYVLKHEKAHANQLHTIDTLLSNITTIIFWFNPFAWLFHKISYQNLEFLADSEAIENESTNYTGYQFTLLKTSVPSLNTSITNNFYNSLLKKRILMIQQNKTSKNKQLAYLLLVPVLTIFMLLFNTKVIAQNKSEKIEVQKMKIELVIEKNSTEENLKKEEKFFKKELNVDLQFKNVKRNANNEITSITINAESENTKSNFECKGEDGIKPIQIAYDSDSKSVSISNIVPKKNKAYEYVMIKKADDNVGEEKEITTNVTVISSDEGEWVSEDGEKKKFRIVVEDDKISDEKDTHVMVISTDKNTEWVTKDGEKKTIKVVVDEDDKKDIKIVNVNSGKEETLQIDSSDENVFVFRNSKEKPLIMIDGKEASDEEMKNLDKNIIKSVSVLKGESAVKKYGEKAENGVIEIETKQ